MELAIDTASERASIALAREGIVQAELSWHAGKNHTAQLIPAIIFLLEQGDLSLEGVKALVVARGPGSFNGLRVGMSTVKGLAYALGIPAVGVGSLAVAAFPYAYAGHPVRPIMDIGRGEVATALFQKRGGDWLKLEEEHITTVEAICSEIASNTVVCGRLPDRTFQLIEGLLGSKAIVVRDAPPSGAGCLAILGWRRLAQGEKDDPVALQPLYLRRPAITQRKGNLNLEGEVKP